MGLVVIAVVAIAAVLTLPEVLPSRGVDRHAVVGLSYPDFHWFGYGTTRASIVAESSWFLPEPSQARPDGRLAVDDAVSHRCYAIGQLAFQGVFLPGSSVGGPAKGFGDEMVVFAASNVTSFHGFEFGVRYGISDGYVYAYTQFPNGFGSVTFQERRLFVNDGLAHAYTLTLAGKDVTFSVDGRLLVTEGYPATPPGLYFVVTTTHRGSVGWTAVGSGLLVESIGVTAP